MKKLMCLGVMVAGALVAQADVVTNSWIGADGAAWGTAANWSAGHVPDGNEYVIFPDAGSSYSVEVDGDYEIGCFYVDYRRKVNGDYDMSGANTTVVDFKLTGTGDAALVGGAPCVARRRQGGSRAPRRPRDDADL